jgi:hypothetical protein
VRAHVPQLRVRCPTNRYAERANSLPSHRPARSHPCAANRSAVGQRLEPRGGFR